MMMYELYFLKNNGEWFKVLNSDNKEDLYRAKDIYKTTDFYRENCYKDRYCIVAVNTDDAFFIAEEA